MCIRDSTKDVKDFFSGGKLNVNSNVQFGEGGAGKMCIRDRSGGLRAELSRL